MADSISVQMTLTSQSFAFKLPLIVDNDANANVTVTADFAFAANFIDFSDSKQIKIVDTSSAGNIRAGFYPLVFTLSDTNNLSSQYKMTLLVTNPPSAPKNSTTSQTAT